MSKPLLRILAFLFIATAFIVLGKRLLQGDFESKPTIEEMKAESGVLVLPKNSILLSEETLSRFTFIGVVKSAESDSSMEEVEKHFRRLAEESGWALKKEIESQRRHRMIFCSGIIAHDIEASPRENGGTRIRAGSYWFADKGDDRFCRGT